MMMKKIKNLKMMMETKQAIEESIEIWEHVVQYGHKPSYANRYWFKCPLCQLYNNKDDYPNDDDYLALRCRECPLYDGIERDNSCCEEYDEWIISGSKDTAKAMLNRLKGELL